VTPSASTIRTPRIWPIIVGLTQIGILLLYLGLGWLGQGATRPQDGSLLLLMLPLLAILPGLWLRRPNAVVWAALVDLFYLAIAITDFWSPGTDRIWLGGIIALTVVGFISAWWHSLLRRRAQRQALRAS